MAKGSVNGACCFGDCFLAGGEPLAPLLEDDDEDDDDGDELIDDDLLLALLEGDEIEVELLEVLEELIDLRSGSSSDDDCEAAARLFW